ncbi:hypothetical protein HYX13_01135 [Candidatus Woesearchaeota archaeon]|nr:hypothetical protein [Candidatus Woesearchaeota archaeon]
MPELPEVETIVRQLKNTVLGKVIEDMGVLDEKYIYRKKNASLQILCSKNRTKKRKKK